MKILVDNGHGIKTPWKRSPDQMLLEYAWTREVAAKVVSMLLEDGYDASLLVPEIDDIPLKERVRRVNYWCNKLGSKNVCVISIHNNAKGMGSKWENAQGWSVFCSSGSNGLVSTGSAHLADCLFHEAEKIGRKMRRQRYDKTYWVQSLAICRETKCPAILTENFFMDNHDDCDYLLSEQGINDLVKAHVDGIKMYCKTFK